MVNLWKQNGLFLDELIRILQVHWNYALNFPSTLKYNAVLIESDPTDKVPVFCPIQHTLEAL